MKLTDKQKELVNKKLKVASACPICGSGKMGMSDTLFEVREFNSGNLVIGRESSVYPLLALSCGSCGHTLFFNAILLGILSRDTKESESDNGE